MPRASPRPFRPVKAVPARSRSHRRAEDPASAKGLLRVSEALRNPGDQHPLTRFQVRHLRQPARVLVLLASLLLLVLARETPWAIVPPALSPLVSLAAVLTTRAVVGIHLLGLLVLAIVVWQRRWFCRWVCPTGWCADRASAVGRRMHRRGPRWPPVGTWIAVFILSGACVGYPFLLWLDPCALLASAVTTLVDPGELSAWWFVCGLTALLAISLAWPHAWCGHICPLGGLQDAAFRIRSGWHARRSSAVELNEALERGPLVFPRRTLLALALGATWGAASRTVSGRTAPIRPPGSVDASQFSALCLRCGNCARACPTDVITHEWGEHGWAGVLTPKVEFRDGYCLESCNQCTTVCPSGAIQPVSLEAKIHTRIGIPVVNMEACLLADDRECSICRNRCPYEAIRFEFDEQRYTLTPRIDLTRCPGCGACEVACPADPVKAIVVEPSHSLSSTATRDRQSFP